MTSATLRPVLRLLLLLGGLVPAAAGGAVAQSAPLRVQRAGPPQVEADPGQTVSAAFRISAGRAAPAVDARMHLPAGWQAVIGDGSVPLAAGQVQLRIVGVAVPRDAAAGRYVVRLVARAGTRIAEDSVRVLVRERRELAVRLEEPPRLVAAGAPYTLVFHVHNRGNAAERVRLELRSADGFPAQADAERVDLPAGGSRTVTVRVATRADLDAELPHRVELRAVSGADAAIVARALATVAVLPRGGRAGSAFHRLPTELRLHSADPRRGGVVAAFTGAGSLGPAGSWIDFALRGRDPGATAFAQADEYRLAVRMHGATLLLGDQVYALSRLTQPGRSAFGAGAEVEWGGVRAGGYASRDRRSGAPGGEGGAYLGWSPGGTSVVRANLLRRTGADPATVASLLAAVSPFQGSRVEAEVAARPGGEGRAHSLLLTGSHARLGYALRHTRADSAFPGAEAGVRADEAHLWLQPFGRVRVSGSFHDRAVVAPFSSATRSLRVAAGYAGWLTAEYRADDRARERFQVAESRAYEGVRVSGSLRRGRFWASPWAEAGTTRDRLGDAESPFRQLALTTGWSGATASLSASLEHSTGWSVHAPRPGERTAVSLHASARLVEGTRVALTVQDATVDAAGWHRRMLDLFVEQELVMGHRLTARLRMVPQGAGGPTRTELALDYAVPLGVPVSRRRDAGGVEGVVVDAASGAGIADLPVRVGGRTAVTDARGRWALAGVRPGTHAVEVDRGSPGNERIPEEAGPLQVVVEGGRTRRLTIRVVRGGTVRGLVRRLAFGEGAAGGGPPPLVAAGGFPGALVALVQPGDTLRRMTDGWGRFDASGVRPGRWTLLLEDAQLPAHHRVEGSGQVVEVGPGTAQEVEMRIVPRHRPVVMVASGAVTLNGGASRPAPASPPAAPPTATSRIARAPAPPAPPATAAPARRAAAAPRPAPATAPAVDHTAGLRPWEVYVVQPGDRSLADVARLFYLDGALWPKLWLANRTVLSDPNRLVPGVRLRVPEQAPLTLEERAVLREYRARRR